MKVFHLPRWINSLNDVVALNNSVYVLMRHARRNDRAYREAKKALIPVDTYRPCGRCNGVGMEIHHIKPIWASAVEYIMSFAPQTTGDTDLILRGRLPGELDAEVNKWHSLNNLVLLCPECHVRQQTVDDLLWKRKLAIQYRLAFSIRWADSLIREQCRNRPKCPVILQDYIDWYIQREYQNGAK